MKFTRITNLKNIIVARYQQIKALSKEDWQEWASDIFNTKILRIKETPEAIELREKAEAYQAQRDCFMEGVPKDKVSTYEAIFHNQHVVWENSNAGMTSSKMLGNGQVIMDMVRSTIPKMTIQELIGFQPMQGPVSLAYKLRYRMEEPEPKKVEDVEPEGQAGLKPSEDNQPSTRFIVGSEGKRMSLEVQSSAVEAGTAKMSASWTIEACEDAKKIHGLDIEKEIVQAMSSELSTEHNQEWLNKIRHVAIPETVDLNDKRDTFGRVVGDNAIPYIIRANCSRIAATTRRGAGNWVVMSPSMLARLQNATAGGSEYKQDALEKGQSIGMTSLMRVGTLSDTIKVYCDMYAPEDELLCGYKGVNGEVDSGMVFCPYILQLSSGVLINPVTFEPVIGFMTRRGMMSDEKTKDYYRHITIKGLKSWGMDDWESPDVDMPKVQH